MRTILLWFLFAILPVLFSCKKHSRGISVTVYNNLTQLPMEGVRVNLYHINGTELRPRGGGYVEIKRHLETAVTGSDGTAHFKHRQGKHQYAWIEGKDVPAWYWNLSGFGIRTQVNGDHAKIYLEPTSILKLRCVNVSPYNSNDYIIVDGAASYYGTQIDRSSTMEFFGGYTGDISWTVTKNWHAVKHDTTLYFPVGDTAYLTINY